MTFVVIGVRRNKADESRGRPKRDMVRSRLPAPFADRGRFARRLLAATAFMALVLLTDASSLSVQLGLGIATALFVLLLTRTSDIEGRQILIAVLVATTGEVVLSLGWGLYTYNHALIPFYVPPGHGLFYLLAAESARQDWLRSHEKWINRSVVVAGSAIAVISLAAFGDTWGFLWWLAALALLRFSRDQLLLSACFSYTIVLEWAGTAIGNWRWMPAVPGIGLHSANPPAGVGLLYILLDLIVIAIATKLLPRRGWPSVAALELPVGLPVPIGDRSSARLLHESWSPGRPDHGPMEADMDLRR